MKYIEAQFVCKFLVDEGVLFYKEKFCSARQNDPTVPWQSKLFQNDIYGKFIHHVTDEERNITRKQMESFYE